MFENIISQDAVSLLKKDLETIKKMTKIVDTSNVNTDNITENVNNLIEVQAKLKDFVEKFNKFSF